MIDKEFIDSICRNFEDDLPVNEQLPEDGFLHIDKLLPFICVYRFKQVDALFSGLLKTQASYLIAKDSLNISNLLDCLASTISKKLNSFLIIEMWPVRKDHEAEFEIFCPKDRAPATIGALTEGIAELRVLYPEISVEVNDTENRHPPHLEPLLEKNKYKESGTLVIGLAVPTIYERPEENEIFSLFYRKFVSQLSIILKRTVYEFIRVQTANPYDHYLMLGKTHIDRITLKADKSLAEVSKKMSFLLRTTPVNSTQQFAKFKENNYSKNPSFSYRLIALDPELEKRTLYDIPIDKVDDPAIAYILRDKRLEIEKQLTMLEERETENFRYIGESLYGPIQKEVLQEAHNILDQFPNGTEISQSERFDCHQFASRAEEELAYYQSKFPKMKLKYEIRNDVAGIMVSETNLLISDQLFMDEGRCDALIQHEIGTHILTYCNGSRQPIQQMHAGFAGYDELQEGLAVLAEYLVGGLTVNRMRLLAGRVIAANSMVSDKSFLDTFNLLYNQYNFPDKTAYYISMRVYRGGGLTKDAVYLSGLMKLLDYLKQGGQLSTLYTGKFNFKHIDLIEELLHRQILKQPELPRFLERDSVKARLEKLRNGIALTDLLN